MSAVYQRSGCKPGVLRRNAEGTIILPVDISVFFAADPERCRELGLISDATASRTYQRLRALDGQPGFTAESVSNFPGERPSLLGQAFDLAAREAGLSVSRLAHELARTSERVQNLLDVQEQKPVLRLVQ